MHWEALRNYKIIQYATYIPIKIKPANVKSNTYVDVPIEYNIKTIILIERMFLSCHVRVSEWFHTL